MIYYIKFNTLQTILFFNLDQYAHNSAIIENYFNTASPTPINDATIN